MILPSPKCLVVRCYWLNEWLFWASDSSNKLKENFIKSNRVNFYVFVLYHFDTNTIHTVAIPNRQAATIQNAWKNTFNNLISKVYPIKHHILDSECSNDLKAAFVKYNIEYQLVSLAEHRVNAAFINHLIAIFCSVDSQFFPWPSWTGCSHMQSGPEPSPIILPPTIIVCPCTTI